MARFFYTFVFYLLLPLVMLRLLWRSLKAPAYRQRWLERFGFAPPTENNRPSIWVHCVSVGETLAALPLIRALLERYPGHRLVVTTTTPTGAERVRAALGDRVTHTYCPYDLPDCLARFLRRVRPCMAIVMETEVWPNTVVACERRGVPVALVNARLSARSARGYQRFHSLFAPVFGALSVVAAQSEADADRLRSVGVQETALSISGNLKFDLAMDKALIEKGLQYRLRWSGAGRPVVLAASTHEGEESLILSALACIKVRYPSVLLVIVPRHPERFGDVQRLSQQHYKVQMHSSSEPIADSTEVVIGDSMGELLALLQAADVVLMGGTWVPRGGHNFIEPASLGKPQLCGPSLFNFALVSQWLLDARALKVVESAETLAQEVCRLLDSPSDAEAMGEAGRQVAEKNRGALERVLAQLDAPLSQP